MRNQTFLSFARNIFWSRSVCGALLLLLLLALTPAPVGAAGASVVVSPVPRHITQNSTGSVSIIVNDYNDPNPPGLGGNGLYGAQIRLTFDKTIVTVASMTAGPLLTSGSNFNVSTFDNTTGTILLGLSEVSPSPGQFCPTPPTPCSGLLYTITFNGVTPGTSPLHIVVQTTPVIYPKLSNPNGAIIPTTSETDGILIVDTPTSTSLTSFTGQGVSRDQARLNWETATELDMLGFNIWSSHTDDTYHQINPALIPAKSPGQLTSNVYHYLDTNLTFGDTYHYKLQVVKANGASEWTLPISIQIGAACSTKPARPKLTAPADHQVVSTRVILDWSDAACAARYRVQLRRDTLDGSLTKLASVSSALTTRVESAHTYYWRVRALAAHRHSKWSEWRSFVVP